MITEKLSYLREGFLTFKSTGSFLPSSRWVANALTEELRRDRGPFRILELGPGTGAITKRILKDMRDDDSLTVCEINPRFMEMLKDTLAEQSRFGQLKDRIEFFLGPVQELPETTKYDVIVCSLPFLNFDLHTVETIFEKLARISTPQTTMRYFEYAGLRPINRLVSPKSRKERFDQLDGFFSELCDTYETKSSIEWRNAAPILVHHLAGLGDSNET